MVSVKHSGKLIFLAFIFLKIYLIDLLDQVLISFVISTALNPYF